MTSKRSFVKMLSTLAGGFVSLPGSSAPSVNPTHNWLMPDESAPHRRTWMAFGASAKVWGGRLLPEVRRNLALIANSISEFEPVAMLVRRDEMQVARKMLASSIQLVDCPLDDLWIRDTGPVFVIGGAGGKAGIDFNFNGWGKKQEHAKDAAVAGFVANIARTTLIRTKLVLEGGGIEVDGHGSAIIAESCVLNANRNPGLTKLDCERSLQQLLGLKKIIWIPGIKGEDITDGHTDFYARFATPGLVMAGYDPDPASYDHAVTKKNIDILSAATDASGKKLNVVTLQAPSSVRKAFETKEFAAGYVGFYVCNGAVISQEFGDPAADLAARDALRLAFPNRTILQLNIDAIAAGGGSIHCATQQEPAA